MENDVSPMKVDINPIEVLNEKVKEIEKGVLKKDSKIIQKVMSRIFSMRKLLTENILGQLLSDNYSTKGDLAKWVQFEVENSDSHKKLKPGELPEVDAFLHLLIVLWFLDSGKYKHAKVCSGLLMNKLNTNGRRTMDIIAARAYFYHSRAYELNGEANLRYAYYPLAGALNEIRNFLISRLRTCTLKSDIAGQAVLINCILRNYLEYNLYEMADKFVSKVKLPYHADNNEWARFLYYLARIKATRLEYSEAHKNVCLSLRKAPEASALGFRQAATKLCVCVELLLGDIPDKKIFSSCKMKASLEPYYKLSQTVRDGNVQAFSNVLKAYSDQFQKDHTYNLILRLHRNVIKVAIRAIGLSYAKISPIQVARKLGLDNQEEAHYILAKAIRDGVIEASLIHGFLVSQGDGDIYKSLAPTETYSERIEACFELHNHSVKSMRFPMSKYESKLGQSGEPEEIDEDLDLFVM